ncbi:MAG: acyl-ACP thioesterase domain-containing protein [Anaerovoracaceae bacterium]|nr:acyl-ACP thioesterase domain-containing protein [Anaerovoracaceae bacterium]
MKEFNAKGLFTDSMFSTDFKIRYSDADENGCLSPGELVNILQSTCIDHSTAAGYGTDYFMKTKTGWALSYWHIFIRQLPHESDIVTLNTWSKEYKRTQAHRDISMLGADGTELVHASTRWVLMDLEKRRPKSTKEIMEAYRFKTALPYADVEFDMPDADEGELIHSREFIILRSELDINRHTNNASYVKWAMNDLPDDIYVDMKMTEMLVKYSHESGFGERVRTETRKTACDDGRVRVSTQEYGEGDELLCTVITYWI